MKDMTGMRFGKLTVVERVGSDVYKNITWKCHCDCGTDIVIPGTYLRSGDTRSCGCLRRELAKEKMSTHGESKSRLYRVWAGIKTRCYNPNSDNYKYYGANGVIMCDEWKNSFEAFKDWSIRNGYDENADAQECTIDRIKNDKPYSPENCRWINHFGQCNNQRSNRVFEYNGEIHTMAEWARILSINYSTLRARIRRGLSFEKAIQKVNA